MGLECDMASADVPREIAGIDGQNLACEPVLFTRKSSNWETAKNWRRFSYVRANLVHVDSHVGVGIMRRVHVRREKPPFAEFQKVVGWPF